MKTNNTAAAVRNSLPTTMELTSKLENITVGFHTLIGGVPVSRLNHDRDGSFWLINHDGPWAYADMAAEKLQQLIFIRELEITFAP